MAYHLRNAISPGRLTGPIFDKELRVSSRRRRNYVVRFLYILVLMVIISLMWAEMMRMVNRSHSSVLMINRMAEIGRSLTLTLVWFQFLLCPVIAAVMLSTAISDEIYHKTLGVLMTTPINSFQIVVGKLMSKLLQLMLLIGLSLPLLAIVRVFGGIPWMYLVVGLSLTFSTMLLAGSLSLFFSISQRKAYIVIIRGLLVFVIAFAVTPALGFLFFHDRMGQQRLLEFFFLTNPYFCMGACTEQLMNPGRSMGVAMITWRWLAHCAIMGGISALLITWSALRVRRVALRQIAGDGAQSHRDPTRRRRKKPIPPDRPARMRSVRGWPVLWKDIHTPVFGRKKKWHKIAAGTVALVLVTITYIRIGLEGNWDERGGHIFFTIIYGLLGTLFTIVIAATSITSEKESRSWPMLLGTTISDREILLSKWGGTLRWCIAPWVLFFGHALLFCACSFIHPLALYHLALIAFGIVMLVTGTGLYWSARLKRTTTAVIANISVPLVLWGVGPLLWGIICGITRIGDDTLEAYMNLHPFYQMGLVMDACARGWGPPRSYHWSGGTLNAFGSTWVLVGTALLWSLVGLAFAWRAKGLFRKRIF